MTNFTSTFKQPKFQSNTTQCVFSSEQRIKNGKTKNLFSCQLLLQLFLKTVSTHFFKKYGRVYFLWLNFLQEFVEGLFLFMLFFHLSDDYQEFKWILIIFEANEPITKATHLNMALTLKGWTLIVEHEIWFLLNHKINWNWFRNYM